MLKFKPNRYIKKAYSLISRSLYFPPVVVLIAILVITIWPWQNAKQNLRTNFDQSIAKKTDDIQAKLIERFAAYNTSLQGGVALLQTNPNLTQSQWQDYFNSMQFTTDRTGLQGTGFTKVFPASELERIQSFMANQGITDFTVRPASTNSALESAVLYLYPKTSNNSSAIGFNMFSEAYRKQAMERARDTGSPALTKSLTLVQNVKTADSTGFLLYVPYFTAGAPYGTVAERQQHLEGFVYGGFRAGILFSQILENTSVSQHFSVKVYDTSVSENNLLYQTKNTASLSKQKNVQQVTRQVTVYGITWQFQFTFDNNYVVSKSESNAPLYILLVGIVTAFLIFLLLLSIFKSRARELQQQKDTEVNLAKDELLSLASHQMRTPATGVKQYLGMVLQGFAGKLSSSQQSLLDKAYTSNERQLQVINQILHLAKLESGRIVLAKHDTIINTLIADIADEQRDELAARGHTLKLLIPKAKITISVDAHMIRMALENLLSNAIKYTLEPAVIQIRLSQTRGRVKISVKDKGIGIDSKEFTQIFKQFTRLYDEKTERISGTGVGLYLADQLIKLHKGTLTVSSKVGEGSEFIISLPIKSRKKTVR